MSAIVFVTLGRMFTYRLMYQSSDRSLNVIFNCAGFVSSSIIFFASQIFSQMNRCFLVSYDVSPRNSGNLIMGSCPSILNYVELLPPCVVDN
jgi:hypothetical protein